MLYNLTMRKLLSLIIITILLFTIFGFAKGSYNSFNKLNQINSNQSELNDLKTINNQLKEKLNEKQSDFYIEKEARDKLGYGRSGETVIVVKDSELDINQSEKDEKEKSNIEKWMKLLKFTL